MVYMCANKKLFSIILSNNVIFNKRRMDTLSKSLVLNDSSNRPKLHQLGFGSLLICYFGLCFIFAQIHMTITLYTIIVVNILSAAFIPLCFKKINQKMHLNRYTIMSGFRE